jgi:hypothetical protein
VTIRLTTIVVLISLSAVASACHGGSPTGASTSFPTSGISSSDLAVTAVDISDAGQDALGRWQYSATVHLRETANIDVTVTSLAAWAVLGSTVLAQQRDDRLALSVPANSTNTATLALVIDTRVESTALRVEATVWFRDANGRSGVVSNSPGCRGCWDY